MFERTQAGKKTLSASEREETDVYKGYFTETENK